VSSLFLSLISNFNLLTVDSLTAPLYSLAASFVGLAILIALMIKYLPHSSAFNRLVLAGSEPASRGYVSAPDYGPLLGTDGAAITTLRPAGMAQLGSDRFDVITDGEYIRAGEAVKVIRVEGRKIVVRKT
jgi:membrane-bound serine protease (ClpP class)